MFAIDRSSAVPLTDQIEARLRGLIAGDLTVEVLKEGVHSGDASGIVPSSFRIIRMLLDRLEDARTGRIIPEWLHIEIPPERIEEARATARHPRASKSDASV